MNLKKTNWNGLEAVEMAAGGWEALLIPSVGANLVRLANPARGLEILHTPTAEEIETFRSRPQLYGLPLLFPPNRIADGTFAHAGHTYRFPITIPAQNNFHHGIIKSLPFVVTRAVEEGDAVEVEASYFSNAVNDDFYAMFPHPFVCRMLFRLSVEGLEHTVTFENQGDEEMPLGVGYHTPLMIPFVRKGNADSYKLWLSVGERWELNDRGLPTGRRMPLDETEIQLRTTGLKPTDTAIEWALTARPLDLDGRPYNGAILKDEANNITVYYEVGPQYGHWTLWNNGGTVPWACPEPQTWIADAPNLALPDEETGFQTLAPGASWSAASRIYVK